MVREKKSSQSLITFCVADIMLNFLATWGDPYYLGLTGLEVIGAEGETVSVAMEMVSADPQDLHVLPGYEGDLRTLDKYVVKSEIPQRFLTKNVTVGHPLMPQSDRRQNLRTLDLDNKYVVQAKRKSQISF